MKFLILILLLSSCVAVPKAHYTTVKIMKIVKTSDGYWVYFRDRIGLYKSFQESKPDSIYPGKLVNMPKVYRINRSL